MNFAISNINGYVKQISMNNKAQANMRNMERSGGQKSEAVSNNSFKATNNSEADMRLTAIVNKMGSGEDLSASDLSYLHENYPEIYSKAVRLANEKREYEAALARCKTKEEARMLHVNQLSKVKKDIDAGVSPEQALETLAMVKGVFHEFTKTVKYGKLSENYTELETRKTKEKTDPVKTDNTESEVHRTEENRKTQNNSIEEEIKVQPNGKEGAQVSTQDNTEPAKTEHIPAKKEAEFFVYNAKGIVLTEKSVESHLHRITN